MEAEPRAQRQLIANLRQERARTILSEMSVPQLADLFSVLPHDDMMELMALLPKEQAGADRDDPLRARGHRPGPDVGRLRDHAQGNHRRRRPAATPLVATSTTT